MYSAFGRIEADVVIVGGGLSGLTAAYTILSIDPSLSVYILEEKSRIGGRMESVTLNTSEGYKIFDLGGQFVRRDQYHFMNLCNKLNLSLTNRNNGYGKTILEFKTGHNISCSTKIEDFGSSLEHYELVKFLGKLEHIIERVNLSNPISIINFKELDGMSMHDFINQNLKSEVNRNFIRCIIQVYIGLEPYQISVLFYAAFCHATSGINKQFSSTKAETKEQLIDGGTEKLINKIKEFVNEIYILKNDPVILIRRNDYEIVVKTKANNSIRTRYVILAIPPNKILNITFIPSLTRSRINILNNMIRTSTVKFIVTYKRTFWKDKGFSGDVYCISNPEIGPFINCTDISHHGAAALCGQIVKNKIYKYEVLKQLARYFGNEALQPLDYIEKCWCSDNMSCRCFPDLNSMEAYNEIRRPLGRMFWAGTETATYWNGYMAGAIQAGYRAGIEVLYDIRPQSLTVDDITDITPRTGTPTHFKESPINQWNNWRLYVPYIIVGTIVFLLRKKLYRFLKFFDNTTFSLIYGGDNSRILLENK